LYLIEITQNFASAVVELSGHETFLSHWDCFEMMDLQWNCFSFSGKIIEILHFPFKTLNNLHVGILSKM